jgi:ubiquinone/menaquinone biosynthesis C-methylase UbiE
MSARPDTGNGRFVPALGRDWLTSLYDPVVRLTTREGTFKRRLLEQAGLKGPIDVLDLGCGTGSLVILAKQASPETNLTGLDGDPQMLSRAREKADKASVAVRFDQGLSYELPYPDASFDRVLSSLFFHHLERGDKERTVEQVRRVLRPGGELHVVDWGSPAGPLSRALFLSIQLLDGFETTRDNVEGLLPWLFERGGFEDVSLRGQMQTVYGTLAFHSAVRA